MTTIAKKIQELHDRPKQQDNFIEVEKENINSKKHELRLWIRDKKSNKMFVLMCYASISFKLQREGVHNLCLKLSKADNNLYHNLKITEDIVCGWADEITILISKCYPEFNEKFGKCISIKDAEEIICSELRILNI